MLFKPPLTEGSPFTVRSFVAKALPQLLVIIYDIVAVPLEIPVTTPPLTEAIPVLLLLQLPPETTSLSAIAEPTQTAEEPVIEPAKGNGLMVTTLVSWCEPQPFVTI